MEAKVLVDAVNGGYLCVLRLREERVRRDVRRVRFFKKVRA